MAVTASDLETQGYSVSLSQEGVYFVEGHGVSTYISEDDLDSIDALADSRIQALVQESVTALKSLAADLEVSGRSSMTKDQLIEAVYTAEQTLEFTQQSEE